MDSGFQDLDAQREQLAFASTRVGNKTINSQSRTTGHCEQGSRFVDRRDGNLTEQALKLIADLDWSNDYNWNRCGKLERNVLSQFNGEIQNPLVDVPEACPEQQRRECDAYALCYLVSEKDLGRCTANGTRLWDGEWASCYAGDSRSYGSGDGTELASSKAGNTSKRLIRRLAATEPNGETGCEYCFPASPCGSSNGTDPRRGRYRHLSDSCTSWIAKGIFYGAVVVAGILSYIIQMSTIGTKPAWVRIELRREEYLRRKAERQRRKLIFNAALGGNANYVGYANALLHISSNTSQTPASRNWKRLTQLLLERHESDAQAATNSHAALQVGDPEAVLAKDDRTVHFETDNPLSKRASGTSGTVHL